MFKEADIIKHLLGFSPLKFQEHEMAEQKKWVIEYKATKRTYYGTNREAVCLTQALEDIINEENEQVIRLIISPAVVGKRKNFELMGLELGI